MFTVAFSRRGKNPLYQQLYRHIRGLIESGFLKPEEKLPSKRALAAHLGVSLKTVENAYEQLGVEGYVDTEEKRGYFVRRIERQSGPAERSVVRPPSGKEPPADGGEPVLFDLGTSRISMRHFPFTVWSKLMRESLRFEAEALLEPVHPQGNPALRAAIANHLRQHRGMQVGEEQIVLGAGTEYLLGLVAELFPGRVFAMENPNSPRWAKILRSRSAPHRLLSMDGEGASLADLRASDASLALVTPSRHFPLGTVMGINRRLGLLRWAARTGRYLIEDDYDNEYRYSLRPVPTLHALDRNNKVIYMNTFTRTLAPSLRVAYLVLPPRLLDRYRRDLMFYSSTVSAFEQSILRRFLADGYYERHVNRIRTTYRNRRDVFLGALEPLKRRLSIHGMEAGLHLLLTAEDGTAEAELVARAGERGVRVYGLSGYYLAKRAEMRTVVVGYAGYDEDDLVRAAGLLVDAWTAKPGRRQPRGRLR